MDINGHDISTDEILLGAIVSLPSEFGLGTVSLFRNQEMPEQAMTALSLIMSHTLRDLARAHLPLGSNEELADLFSDLLMEVQYLCFVALIRGIAVDRGLTETDQNHLSEKLVQALQDKAQLHQRQQHEMTSGTIH